MHIMHQDTHDIRRDDVRQGRQHRDVSAVLMTAVQPSLPCSLSDGRTSMPSCQQMTVWMSVQEEDMEDGAPRHMNMLMRMVMRRMRRQRVGRHDERTGLHACIPISQPYGEYRHRNTSISETRLYHARTWQMPV